MAQDRLKPAYRTAEAVGGEGGFRVALDGRPMRSPARRDLLLPTRALAEALAAEWRAQGADADPRAMPMTTLAATAIDRAGPRRAETEAAIAAYGASDLLCHRADAPPELVRRQAAAWDPLLDWCAGALGARLRPGTGVMPLRQSAGALAAIRAAVAGRDAFALTALREFATGFGSAVLALAVAEGRIDAGAGLAAAQIDEAWQEERWGADAEAARRRDALRRDILAAERFLRLARSWN